MKLGHPIIFIIALFSSTLSFSQDAVCKFDTSRFVELLHTQFPYKNYDTISFVERSKLTENEKCVIQKLLIDLFTKNQDSLTYGYSDYKIQLVSALDRNGRKFVWVNGICNEAPKNKLDNWKSLKIRTVDGGECYFQGLVDLKNESMIHLFFNSEARIKKLNSKPKVEVCDATKAK